jgi:hypothetical protein
MEEEDDNTKRKGPKLPQPVVFGGDMTKKTNNKLPPLNSVLTNKKTTEILLMTLDDSMTKDQILKDKELVMAFYGYDLQSAQFIANAMLSGRDH